MLRGLRPAIGVVELSQCIIQAVPLSARNTTGGSLEGIAPFLQLPHVNETVIKKVALKDLSWRMELRRMRTGMESMMTTMRVSSVKMEKMIKTQNISIKLLMGP